LSDFLLVLRITTDQPFLQGGLSNKWTVAILTKADFFVLLRDPTFQMNNHVGIGVCSTCELTEGSEAEDI
jgi:hypothetical protein